VAFGACLKCCDDAVYGVEAFLGMAVLDFFANDVFGADENHFWRVVEVCDGVVFVDECDFYG
jgi:hypothetical protein